MNDLDNIRTELKTIPHLKLDINVNITDILKEIPTRDNFYGWEPDPEDTILPKHVRDLHSKWIAAPLFDFYTESKKIKFKEIRSSYKKMNLETWDDLTPKTYPTDIAEQCPNTVETLYRIGNRPGRCRFSIIQPKLHLNWHSHYQGRYDDNKFQNEEKSSFNTPEYNYMVVHLPIITNELAVMGVRKIKTEESSAVWEHYPLNEVRIFNSYYYHNAFNNGDDDRLHLLMYYSLTDDLFRGHVENALNSYNGLRF